MIASGMVFSSKSMKVATIISDDQDAWLQNCACSSSGSNGGRRRAAANRRRPLPTSTTRPARSPPPVRSAAGGSRIRRRAARTRAAGPASPRRARGPASAAAARPGGGGPGTDRTPIPSQPVDAAIQLAAEGRTQTRRWRRVAARESRHRLERSESDARLNALRITSSGASSPVKCLNCKRPAG